MGQAEFVDFLIDSQLKQEAKDQQYATKEEIYSFEQDMKKLLVFLALSTSCFAADLQYLVDLRTALMDDIGITSATTFWSSTRLNRMINRSIRFVEAATKSNQITIGYELSNGVFRYSLGDTISQNGIEFAFWTPITANNNPTGLSYKPAKDFGKSVVTEPSIYTVWNNIIYISSLPATTDSVYFLCYRVSSDLAADSATTLLPKGAKRELVVDYAYLLCLKAERRFAELEQERNAFLTKFQLVTGIALKQAEVLAEPNP
jgi:hypothetical protein